MTRVLTFGTFDGVHDGHRAMLKEAKALGHAGPDPASTICYLIVAVAPDSIAKEIKGTLPKYSSAQRVTTLKNEHLADEVVIGDEKMHSWKIVKKYKPNVIALGYDQQDLKNALEEYLEKSYPDVESEDGDFKKNPKRPTIVMLSAYEPHKYKSSFFK